MSRTYYTIEVHLTVDREKRVRCQTNFKIVRKQVVGKAYPSRRAEKKNMGYDRLTTRSSVLSLSFPQAIVPAEDQQFSHIGQAGRL